MSIYVDSLLSLVQSVKPYHTKILGVEISYVASETMNVTMTEELLISVNVGLPLDKIVWNYSDIQNGITPANQLADTMSVTFIEEFNVDLTYVDTGYPDVPYNTNPSPWDSPYGGFPITSVLSNGFVVIGDITSIFINNPQLVFEVIGGVYNGLYDCDNAIYDNSTNTTMVYTIQPLTPSSQTIIHGFINLSLWDSVGWDGSIAAPSVGPATFSVNSDFGERFTIQEGIAWDDSRQGGWDSTDGTYTGTNPEHLHMAEYWSNPCEWDQAVYLIADKSYTISPLQLPYDGCDMIVPNSGVDHEKRVVFGYNDTPIPHRLKNIHTQVAPSTIWEIDVSEYYNPHLLAYDNGNNPLEWINIERPTPVTILLTFSTPVSGYILGV